MAEAPVCLPSYPHHLHRLDQLLDPQNIHHAGEIVGQHVQGHFGCHLGQGTSTNVWLWHRGAYGIHRMYPISSARLSGMVPGPVADHVCCPRWLIDAYGTRCTTGRWYLRPRRFSPLLRRGRDGRSDTPGFVGSGRSCFPWPSTWRVWAVSS